MGFEQRLIRPCFLLRMMNITFRGRAVLFGLANNLVEFSFCIVDLCFVLSSAWTKHHCSHASEKTDVVRLDERGAVSAIRWLR
jgi:hypothetical protein